MEDRTWGALLRFYRRQAYDPQRGGLLAQKRLADLLSEQCGVLYSRATISDWERDRSKIHVDDRRILCSLVQILYQCGGVPTAVQADEWLRVGNYRALNEMERQAIGFHAPVVVDASEAAMNRRPPSTESRPPLLSSEMAVHIAPRRLIHHWLWIIVSLSLVFTLLARAGDEVDLPIVAPIGPDTSK